MTDKDRPDEKPVGGALIQRVQGKSARLRVKTENLIPDGEVIGEIGDKVGGPA